MALRAGEVTVSQRQLRSQGGRMGLIAKSQTKKRVASSSGPLNTALAGSPWLTTGAIPTAALVRSAVFALNLAGTTSSAIRGRQNAIAAALLSPLTSGSSKLWVETIDFKGWDIVLGMTTAADGIAADWVVKLIVDGSSATVVTTNYLVRNDVLVNGEHHDAIRNELLRALALGEQTDAAVEAQIGATSLGLAQPFADAAPQPFELSFSIVTTLDQTTIRERLGKLGHRVLSDSPTSTRWGVGLAKNDAFDHVTFEPQPGKVLASAKVTSESGAGRRIAAVALKEFIRRAVFLIRGADEKVAYEGPAAWEPYS